MSNDMISGFKLDQENLVHVKEKQDDFDDIYNDLERIIVGLRIESLDLIVTAEEEDVIQRIPESKCSSPKKMEFQETPKKSQIVKSAAKFGAKIAWKGVRKGMKKLPTHMKNMKKIAFGDYSDDESSSDDEEEEEEEEEKVLKPWEKHLDFRKTKDEKLENVKKLSKIYKKLKRAKWMFSCMFRKRRSRYCKEFSGIIE